MDIDISRIYPGKCSRFTDARDKVKCLFESVRDIPYRLVRSYDYSDKSLEDFTGDMSGSCEPKHHLLGYILEKEGISVRYMTYRFRWADTGIAYPAGMTNLINALPDEYHLALKMSIESKWVLTDCTWDKDIEGPGFNVNRNWNGMDDTKIAVWPIEEVEHSTIGDHARYVEKMRKSFSLSEKRSLLRFIKEFNTFLAAQRAHS